MAKPNDMRIGDAERDAVASALHEHFAAGRLNRDELDERLGAALGAKTQGDLKAIVDDLPGPNGLPEPAKRRHVHHPHHGYEGYAGYATHYGQVTPRHHRRGPFPAFPLLLVAFLIVTVTAGAGTGLLVVLQTAMLIWIIKAILLAARARRTR